MSRLLYTKYIHHETYRKIADHITSIYSNSGVNVSTNNDVKYIYIACLLLGPYIYTGSIDLRVRPPAPPPQTHTCGGPICKIF